MLHVRFDETLEVLGVGDYCGRPHALCWVRSKESDPPVPHRTDPRFVPERFKNSPRTPLPPEHPESFELYFEMGTGMGYFLTPTTKLPPANEMPQLHPDAGVRKGSDPHSGILRRADQQWAPQN